MPPKAIARGRSAGHRGRDDATPDRAFHAPPGAGTARLQLRHASLSLRPSGNGGAVSRPERGPLPDTPARLHFTARDVSMSSVGHSSSDGGDRSVDTVDLLDEDTQNRFRRVVAAAAGDAPDDELLKPHKAPPPGEGDSFVELDGVAVHVGGVDALQDDVGAILSRLKLQKKRLAQLHVTSPPSPAAAATDDPPCAGTTARRVDDAVAARDAEAFVDAVRAVRGGRSPPTRRTDATQVNTSSPGQPAAAAASATRKAAKESKRSKREERGTAAKHDASASSLNASAATAAPSPDRSTEAAHHDTTAVYVQRLERATADQEAQNAAFREALLAEMHTFQEKTVADYLDTLKEQSNEVRAAAAAEIRAQFAAQKDVMVAEHDRAMGRAREAEAAAREQMDRMARAQSQQLEGVAKEMHRAAAEKTDAAPSSPTKHRHHHREQRDDRGDGAAEASASSAAVKRVFLQSEGVQTDRAVAVADPVIEKPGGAAKGATKPLGAARTAQEQQRDRKAAPTATRGGAARRALTQEDTARAIRAATTALRSMSGVVAARKSPYLAGQPKPAQHTSQWVREQQKRGGVHADAQQQQQQDGVQEPLASRQQPLSPEDVRVANALQASIAVLSGASPAKATPGGGAAALAAAEAAAASPAKVSVAPPLTDGGDAAQAVKPTSAACEATSTEPAGRALATPACVVVVTEPETDATRDRRLAAARAAAAAGEAAPADDANSARDARAPPMVATRTAAADAEQAPAADHDSLAAIGAAASHVSAGGSSDAVADRVLRQLGHDVVREWLQTGQLRAATAAAGGNDSTAPDNKGVTPAGDLATLAADYVEHEAEAAVRAFLQDVLMPQMTAEQRTAHARRLAFTAPAHDDGDSDGGALLHPDGDDVAFSVLRDLVMLGLAHNAAGSDADAAGARAPAQLGDATEHDVVPTDDVAAQPPATTAPAAAAATTVTTPSTPRQQHHGSSAHPGSAMNTPPALLPALDHGPVDSRSTSTTARPGVVATAAAAAVAPDTMPPTPSAANAHAPFPAGNPAADTPAAAQPAASDERAAAGSGLAAAQQQQQQSPAQGQQPVAATADQPPPPPQAPAESDPPTKQPAELPPPVVPGAAAASASAMTPAAALPPVDVARPVEDRQSFAAVVASERRAAVVANQTMAVEDARAYDRVGAANEVLPAPAAPPAAGPLPQQHVVTAAQPGPHMAQAPPAPHQQQPVGAYAQYAAQPAVAAHAPPGSVPPIVPIYADQQQQHQQQGGYGPQMQPPYAPTAMMGAVQPLGGVAGAPTAAVQSQAVSSSSSSSSSSDSSSSSSSSSSSTSSSSSGGAARRRRRRAMRDAAERAVSKFMQRCFATPTAAQPPLQPAAAGVQSAAPSAPTVSTGGPTATPAASGVAHAAAQAAVAAAAATTQVPTPHHPTPQPQATAQPQEQQQHGPPTNRLAAPGDRVPPQHYFPMPRRNPDAVTRLIVDWFSNVDAALVAQRDVDAASTAAAAPAAGGPLPAPLPNDSAQREMDRANALRGVLGSINDTNSATTSSTHLSSYDAEFGTHRFARALQPHGGAARVGPKLPAAFRRWLVPRDAHGNPKGGDITSDDATSYGDTSTADHTSASDPSGTSSSATSVAPPHGGNRHGDDSVANTSRGSTSATSATTSQRSVALVAAVEGNFAAWANMRYGAGHGAAPLPAAANVPTAGQVLANVSRVDKSACAAKGNVWPPLSEAPAAGPLSAPPPPL